MSTASTLGSSFGRSGKLLSLLLLSVDDAIDDVLFEDAVVVLAERVSSHPAFSSTFIPAYSTSVHDGPGDESHSNGSEFSSAVLDDDGVDEP